MLINQYVAGQKQIMHVHYGCSIFAWSIMAVREHMNAPNFALLING